MRYWPPFPAVVPRSRANSHALLTRLPLDGPRRTRPVRLACVKPAASVRSEPGSNSQVTWATDRHRSIAPATGNEERSEEHTSELQSLMSNSSAVSFLKKKKLHII